MIVIGSAVPAFLWGVAFGFVACPFLEPQDGGRVAACIRERRADLRQQRNNTRDGLTFADGVERNHDFAADRLKLAACLKLRALRRVHHLEMELGGVEFALLVGDEGEGRVLGQRRERTDEAPTD